MFEFLSSGFYELIDFIRGIDPAYIYLILFGMAFMENIIPPIPGDTFSIIGGYLAASGQLQLIPTFLAITIGCIASIMLVYGAGRWKGRSYFLNRDFRFFSANDVQKVSGWFASYGISVLLISRFIVGFRVALAVGAGIARVPVGRMLILSYISGAIFHGLLMALAYLLYAYIDHVREGFDIYSRIVLAAVVILIIIWLILIIRRYRNGQEKS